MMFTVWFVAIISCILLTRWTWLILTTSSDWQGWMVEFMLLFTAATTTGVIYAGSVAEFLSAFGG